jgi:hypothetical protein
MMARGSVFRERLWRYLGQKFVLTAGSLSAVFTLAFIGKDVRQLEIIVPAVLAFYYGANVAQKQVLKNQGESSDGSVDNGGNAP